jgi:2-polyprenyl-3-methyl-5-hydroxy-6-metoxy-1,4-benzoquinol methylase
VAAQHYVFKEMDLVRFAALANHIKQLWGQDTCEILKCASCGFVFSFPFVAGDAKFYDLGFKRSGYPKWKWEYAVSYEAILKMLRPDFRILEIGAGDGAFIKKIANVKLPPGNILCTEFSDYGKTEIEKLGVECLQADVRSMNDPELKHSFDAICMFQVLEHMDNLDELFSKLKWLMKDGASLFIAVPNEKRIEFNEMHKALLDMPPNHVGRWNKECFNIIGKRFGLVIHDYQLEKSGIFEKAKQFIMYRFFYKAQISGSIENHLVVLAKVKYRNLAKMIGVTLNLVPALPSLPVLLNAKSTLGDSQWIQFINKQE